MMESRVEGAGRRGQDGSQTLARGLTALITVIESETGLTVQDVAKRLSVHRSICYRLLQTFVEFGFLTRSAQGLYRPGARLVTLSDAFLPHLLDLARPIMRELAESTAATVARIDRGCGILKATSRMVTWDQ